MKLADRQLLYDELMKGALVECDGDVGALAALEELTTKDLDAIEPLIDKMLARTKEVTVQQLLQTKNGWNDGAVAFEVIPDGTSCLVFAHMAGKQYVLEVERVRLRAICQFLITESEK
jgi:hypothetical protein